MASDANSVGGSSNASYPSPSSPTQSPDMATSVAAMFANFDRQTPQTLKCYRHTSAQHRAESEATYRELSRQVAKLPESTQVAVERTWTDFAGAPSATRILILAGLLNQCCIPQLSFLHRSVAPLLRIDFIAMTPPQVALKIMAYLDAKTLCRAAQVSKTWQALADDDRLWHRMCEQHIDRKCTSCGWGLPLLHKKKRRCEVTDQDLVNSGRTPPTSFSNVCTPTVAPVNSVAPTLKRPAASDDDEEVSGLTLPGVDAAAAPKRARTDPEDTSMATVPGRRPWKQIYAERLRVERNWRRGNYRLRVLEGHTDGVLCLQFDDQYIMTGSYDQTIRVWNAETGAAIRTLRGHSQGVRALQFDQVKLISGSLDGTVRIWNYRTGHCLRVMEVGGGGVNCLHFDSTLLAAGCVDGSISAWNFKSGATSHLVGHTDWVNAVRLLDSSRLLSCSDDTTVRLWDLDTRTCTRVFNGHVGHVQTFQLASHPWQLPCTLLDECRRSNDQGDIDGDDQLDHGHSSDTDSAASGPRTPGSHDTAAVRRAIRHYGPAPPPHPTPSSSLFTANVFVTGGLDSTLKVWDLDRGKCLDTLFGHTEGIWSLAMDSLRIVSASNDATIKVWDTQSRRCLQTLRGHDGPVNCVGLSDVKVISGGMDHRVRIWDFGLADGE
ncbi:hypothetical protein IWQ60_004163 [Tieghemiomyces parasiticus]|uniref:F-box domain-containing protein n=1 Tax=Tieghemiomyces parasiticus TaxID=78921 RepID=A0A9W8AGP1_9FUNG|nr:hypothetical protein IWQ60_004163 [Tieghemiomyces parasiticus]